MKWRSHNVNAIRNKKVISVWNSRRCEFSYVNTLTRKKLSKNELSKSAWRIKGCLHEKPLSGASFIPRWLFDFVSCLHDDGSLKVHFMLIKYTCDSKSQTLRMRYPFQSTGRPISHWNGWSCRVYMIPLQNLVPESFNLFTFFQEDINQSKVVNSFQLSSDCINLYERMRINKKRSHFSAPCCKWTVVTY